jgi:tetratricopeptide (TPR) repeat protein/ferric-dicitrate binding protein FerR (iron transport regulator)
MDDRELERHLARFRPEPTPRELDERIAADARRGLARRRILPIRYGAAAAFILFFLAALAAGWLSPRPQDTPAAPPAVELRADAPRVAAFERVDGLTVARLWSRSAAAYPGLRLEEPARVRVEDRENSGAVARLPDGTRLYLNAGAHVELGDTLRVESGQVFVEVPKTRRDRPLLFHTPQGQVRVTGTKFLISAAADSMEIAVTEGSVRWEEIDVTGGQSARAAKGDRPRVRPMTAARIGAWLDRLMRPSEEDRSLGSLVASVDGRSVPLSIRAHRVKAVIRDQIARTFVDEVFYNNTDRRLEGTFFYPLPPDGSISNFAMYVGDRLMEGEIVERTRAREIFETIVNRREDPALLEWMGGNLFKARVFPIEPHSEKRVQITFTQFLPRDGDTVRYGYPLRSEKLAHNPVEELSIDVEVHSTPPIASVDCASHRAEVTREPHRGVVRFSARNYPPTADFAVSYRLDPKAAECVLVPHWREDEEGYFLAVATPEFPQIRRDVPRETLFVVDVSGSIGDDIYGRVTRAVRGALELMDGSERFNILLFDISARPLSPGFLENTPENRKRAAEFLDSVLPYGATDLTAALQAAGALVESSAHVLYLGDGVATWGSSERAGVAAALEGAFKNKSVTLDALVLGGSCDRDLLEEIVRPLAGTVRFLPDSESIEKLVTAMVDERTRPVMTDVSISVDGVETDRVFPKRPPNIRRGQQVIVAGRFKGKGAATLRVTGKIADQAYRREHQVRLDAAANPFVPRLWARRCIDQLLTEPDKRAEIVQLSRKYRIVTPYTSFLVLETEEDYRRFGVEREFELEDGENAASKKPDAPRKAEESEAQSEKKLQGFVDVEWEERELEDGRIIVKDEKYRGRYGGRMANRRYSHREESPVFPLLLSPDRRRPYPPAPKLDPKVEELLSMVLKDRRSFSFLLTSGSTAVRLAVDGGRFLVETGDTLHVSDGTHLAVARTDVGYACRRAVAPRDREFFSGLIPDFSLYSRDELLAKYRVSARDDGLLLESPGEKIHLTIDRNKKAIVRRKDASGETLFDETGWRGPGSARTEIRPGGEVRFELPSSIDLIQDVSPRERSHYQKLGDAFNLSAILARARQYRRAADALQPLRRTPRLLLHLAWLKSLAGQDPLPSIREAIQASGESAPILQQALALCQRCGLSYGEEIVRSRLSRAATQAEKLELSTQLAWWLGRSGRIDEARKIWSQLALENDQALLPAADYFRNLGELEEAERLVRQARAKSIDAGARLAQILSQRGRLDEARAEYEALLSGPHPAHVVYEYLQLGDDMEVAWARCREVLDRRPDDKELAQRLLDYFRSCGWHDQAASLFERTIERRPEDLQLSLTLFQNLHGIVPAAKRLAAVHRACASGEPESVLRAAETLASYREGGRAAIALLDRIPADSAPEIRLRAILARLRALGMYGQTARWKSAREALKAEVERFKPDPVTRSLYESAATTLMGSSDVAEAIALYRLVESALPDSVYLDSWKQHLIGRLGAPRQVDAVAAFFRELLRRDSGDRLARFGVAQACEASRLQEEAFAHYWDLMQKEDSDGLFNSAWDALRRIAGNSPHLADRLEQSLSEKADDPFPSLKLDLLSIRGKKREMARLLGRMIENEPEELSWRWRRASALEALGEHREAIEDYLEILEREPGAYQAQLQISQVRARQGDARRARQHWEAAIRIAGENESILYSLASQAQSQRRWTEAAELYELLVRRNAGYSRQLSEALQMAGRTEEAALVFVRYPSIQTIDELWPLARKESIFNAVIRAIDAAPESALLHKLAGDLFQRRGAASKAKDQYERAIRLDSGELVLSLVHLVDRDLAIERLRRALSDRKLAWEPTREKLAYLLWHRGDRSAGLTELLEKGSDDDRHHVWRFFAGVNAESSFRVEAIAAYRQAMKLGSSDLRRAAAYQLASYCAKDRLAVEILKELASSGRAHERRDALQRLLSLHQGEGRHAEATGVCRRLLKTGTYYDRWNVLQNHLGHLFGRDLIDEAIELCGEVFETLPHADEYYDSQHLNRLAELILQRGKKLFDRQRAAQVLAKELEKRTAEGRIDNISHSVWEVVQAAGQAEELAKRLEQAAGAERARVLFWLAGRTRSIDTYIRALEADPENPSTVLEALVRELWEKGRFAEAIEYQDRLIRELPESWSAWLRKAELHSELSDGPGAQRAYSRCRELAAEDGDALFAIGLSLRNRKRPKEAVEVLLRAAERATRRDSDWTRSLQLELGRAYGELGDLERSTDAFLAAMSASSNPGARQPILDEMTAVIAGAGQLEEFARRYLWRVEKEGVEKPYLRAAFGRAYLKASNSGRAVVHLRKALEMIPFDPTVHRDLIEGLKKLRDPAQVERAYRALSRSHPADMSVYREFAEWLQATGRPADAARAASMMVEAAPGEATGYAALAQWEEDRGRWAPAIALTQKRISARPEDPAGYWKLAELRAKSGDLEGARGVYRSMLDRAWNRQLYGDVESEVEGRLRALQK